MSNPPRNAKAFSTVQRVIDKLDALDGAISLVQSLPAFQWTLDKPVYLTPNSSAKAGLAGDDWICLNAALLGEPDDMKATFLHELAHLVANRHYGTNCHHDARWKSIARQLGDSGERCHTYDYIQPKRQPRRFTYECVVCAHQYHTARRLKHDGVNHYHPECGKLARLRRIR